MRSVMQSSDSVQFHDRTLAKLMDGSADMKTMLKTCATAITGMRGLPQRNGRLIAAASIICFILGLALSRRIESGIRVQKITLTEQTPALKFIPTGAGPHPVALLAHGYAGSKETLFRYGEALAAAGFLCYSVDQPGHGASPRTYTYLDVMHALEAVAREVGPVDVFAGHSMGGFKGGEAVRKGGMRPGLFIAIGSTPVLGDHTPPLLLLTGRFEEAFPPALLKTRSDTRLVISPWSDHLLEGFDPLLVNAAVQAACAALHKTPPAPPSAWRWRLIGIVLAMLAAGILASSLTDLFPRLARFRGLLIGVFIAAAFMLTVGGRWIDARPHLRLQGIAMPVTFILAIIAGRLRLPQWSFAALGVLVLMIAVGWFKASPSWATFVFLVCTLLLSPALIVGVAIGWAAARRGSRLQGDIAMAIFVGFVPFQCLELPRTAPQAPTPHIPIKLDAKLLDACIGEYEMVPDNVFPGTKVTIRRNGDHLVWQTFGRSAFQFVSVLYPESDTIFFLKKFGAQVTFTKNDQGEVMAIIHHKAGLPDSEGRRLGRNQTSPSHPRSVQAETSLTGASPFAVPEPSPRAIGFYHSTMRLIAVFILWNLLIPVGFLFTGFSAKLRSWAEKAGRPWYFSYVLYFMVFILIYLLLLAPLAFYGQFIHLHHYDLSNQSFARWLSCLAKSAAILLLIGLVAGWIPFFIIRKSPRRWWLYLGLLAPLYLCFMLWIQPVLIDPLYHRFTPLQDQALERELLAMADRAGIQDGRVFQVNMSVDSKIHNAYVTGFMGTKRIVLYDTTLQSMNQDELLFIMGHEMGHYVLRHVAKRITLKSILILVTLYVVCRLAGPVMGRFKNIWGVAAPSDFAALPLGVLAFWFFCIVVRPVDMAFSRHIEHEADRFGLELTRKNHAAATAFGKFMQLNLGIPRPGTIYKIWFGSHPCIADRIEFYNTYHPWETGQPSKYEEYMNP